MGVTPQAGGEHSQFGTHNCLLKIATPEHPLAYLEVIAIQPGAKGPANPHAKRWFDMDQAPLRAAVAQAPRLVHWVASTDAMLAARIALKNLGIERGPALPASRHSRKGVLHWQVTVREDGQRLFDGTLPSLIQWGNAEDAAPLRLHPRNSLPRSRVSLDSVSVTHPSAEKLHAAYAAIGLEGIRISEGPANLRATLKTPKGLVSLESLGL